MAQSQRESTASTMVGYEYRDFCLGDGDVVAAWSIAVAFTIVLMMPSWIGG